MSALSQSDLTRLRQTQHQFLPAIAVYAPPAIWKARVSGNHDTGAINIAVSAVTEIRPPQLYYRVLFGTSEGARDLGVALYRSYSNGVLKVTAHNAKLPDGAYITILEVVPPESILFRLDDNDTPYECGDIAYVEQNTNYAPLVRIGCPAVGYINSNGNAVVNFFAIAQVFAGGSTITSYQWDFADGTAESTTIPGSADNPIAVTYTSPGWRYVSCTVTDSNGKTATRRVPILVREQDDALAYTSIELQDIQGSRDSHGWTATIRVFADASPSAFPDEAMVVLFAREFYGDDEVNIGGYWRHRENVKLVGYIRRGTVKANINAGYVEFEIAGVGAFCDALYAPAFSLELAETPAHWHQLRGLTNRLAIHHILTQHSTLSIIADATIGILEYANEFLDFAEGTLSAQLTNLCDDGCGRNVWGSTAQGMLYFQPNPQLQPVADREIYPVVLTTIRDDFRDEIDIDDEPIARCGQVDLGAVTWDGETYFSVAPRNRLPYGEVKRVEETRCDSQEEANQLAGNLFALENLNHRAVTLHWRGAYWVFDPFVVERVRVNLDVSLNRRGIVWENQTCWTTRVSAEYRTGGVLLIDTVVERDTSGDAGTTQDTGGVDNNFPITPPTYPPYPILPPIVPPGVPPGPVKQASIVYDITDGFSDTLPAGSSIQLLNGATVRRCKFNKLVVICDDNDVTLAIYVSTHTTPSVVAIRNNDGTWTVNRYNGATGALISSQSRPSGRVCRVTWAGASVLALTSDGIDIRVKVTAGANSVQGLRYGLGGYVY